MFLSSFVGADRAGNFKQKYFLYGLYYYAAQVF